MHEHHGFLGLIAQGTRQPAVILMRVRQDDAANIGNAKPGASQPFAQSLRGLFRLRPRINQRHRVFGNEVAINRPDVERGGNGDGNYFHNAKLKMQKERWKARSSSSLLHFTFLIFH
jgi:hypothetical protein